MTDPCPHGNADPHMCLECRHERLTGRPARTPGDFANELADAIQPGRLVELGAVDHALVLSEDLQQILGHVRYVALTWEDASALLRAANRNGRLAAGVAVRVSEALAEAFAAEPGLRPGGANAISPGQTPGDHGGNSTSVDHAGGGPGGDRDPDPP